MNSLRSFLNSLCLLLFLGVLGGCAVAPAPLRFEAVAPESEWRIAVFPIENLSGVPAPLKDLRSELMAEMHGVGLRPVEANVVDRFMAQHWIRYSGGIDGKDAQALRQETGADAVLITNLELYDETYPPKLAFISRLVITGPNPEIFWMDSVSLTGADAPGILGLGLIEDPRQLRMKALGQLSSSLERFLADPESRARANGLFSGRYAPRFQYKALDVAPETRPTITVIPFFNESTRKHAGEIQVLHFVRELVRVGSFSVLEPGVLREKMLNMRVIMQDGISIPYIDLLANTLNVDYLLTGKVFDYQDVTGGGASPKVDYSVQVIEKGTKKVVWTSSSWNRGDDGVYFYDWGRINTASALAGMMTRALVRDLASK